MAVPLLLDNYREVLKGFKEDFEKGLVKSDVIYQKELLSRLFEHYLGCIEYYEEIKTFPKGPEKVFVFLPSNVPLVIFEVMPLLLVSGVKEVFFKFSSREKTFIYEFIKRLREKISGLIHIDGEYLSHEESLVKVREYDFLMGFGSEKLGGVISKLGKHYRFFGPKFSIGIFKGQDSNEIFEKIAWDNLSFDTRGCLSLRVLFSIAEVVEEDLISAFEKVSHILPPESDFRRDEAEYEVLRNFERARFIFRGRDYFIVFSEGFIELNSLRTLLVVNVPSVESVYDIIKPYGSFIQGVAVDFEGFNMESASLITEFSKLQFPTCHWLFEQGVTLKNFWEV